MFQSAFALTEDRQIGWVGSDGGFEAVSDTGFALDLNVAADGTVWAIGTESGSNGNLIKYLLDFPNNKSDWKTLNTELGADQVMGRSKGQCVFLAPDQSVHIADTKGGHSQIIGAGAAMRVAALGDFPIDRGREKRIGPFCDQHATHGKAADSRCIQRVLW